MVNKNVLSCPLKDGRKVDAVTLVGRLFHACATVTRNDRSPMVLSRIRGTIRRGQEPDRSRCRVDTFDGAKTVHIEFPDNELQLYFTCVKLNSFDILKKEVVS